jgi:hypothetical protein
VFFKIAISAISSGDSPYLREKGFIAPELRCVGVHQTFDKYRKGFLNDSPEFFSEQKIRGSDSCGDQVALSKILQRGLLEVSQMHACNLAL